MARWKKNEPTAAKRRALLVVYDDSGVLAVPTTTFAASGELSVDPSTGTFVAAVGTLTPARKTLVVADDTVDTVDATDNELDLAAHGLLTGDGPIQFTTSGTLPGGMALATDYYVIKVNTGSISLATTSANAIAGTEIDITSAGTGTHTLVDTASTTRMVDGHWIYEPTQAEINITGCYFAIKIEKTGYPAVTVSVDIYEDEMEMAALSTGETYGDLLRLLMAVCAGPVTDFTTNTLVFLCPATGVTRLTVTTAATGRLVTTLGDLT